LLVGCHEGRELLHLLVDVGVKQASILILAIEHEQKLWRKIEVLVYTDILARILRMNKPRLDWLFIFDDFDLLLSSLFLRFSFPLYFLFGFLLLGFFNGLVLCPFYLFLKLLCVFGCLSFDAYQLTLLLEVLIVLEELVVLNIEWTIHNDIAPVLEVHLKLLAGELTGETVLACILHWGCFRVSLVVIGTCTVLGALRCLRSLSDHVSNLALHESLVTCWSFRSLKLDNAVALRHDGFCSELVVGLEGVEALILNRKYHVLNGVVPQNCLLLLVHRNAVRNFLMLTPDAFELVSDVLVVGLVLVSESHQMVVNILYLN
jgi:hypothetical protein